MRVRSVVIALLGAAMVAAVVHAAPPPVVGPARATATAQRLGVAGPLDQRGTVLGGCAVFPADNPWNTPVRDMARRSSSDATVAYIQAHGAHTLHPDFGENPAYGIPYAVVPADQPLVPVVYDEYGEESDPGPFPIPNDAPVESGGDGHVLVLRQGRCDLFELYVGRRSGAGWVAASGARFDLASNALRPAGWTSADAAGLPILPGLVRYEEVAAGRITHAIRVTFSSTRRGYVLPATHWASSVTDPAAPPMGLRLRLRADYDLAGIAGQARVIAEAMKEYGLIVADNGSNWFFQGAPNPGWNDTDLDQLKSIPGTAFEVVDTGPVVTS